MAWGIVGMDMVNNGNDFDATCQCEAKDRSLDGLC